MTIEVHTLDGRTIPVEESKLALLARHEKEQSAYWMEQPCSRYINAREALLISAEEYTRVLALLSRV